MNTKIFQQGANSKKSSNVNNGLNVRMGGKRRLLPMNDVAEVVSQYEQYQEERKNCETIRLTCQVNPICSNVLFNGITEVVRNEGSDTVTFLNYHLDNTNGRCFSGVTFKSQEMDFWGSGEMKYQGTDEIINSLSITTKLEKAVTSNTHYNNASNIQSKDPYREFVNLYPTNAIRDTQLSNSKCGFVYHCGLDFLNNHLIRSKTFKTVCKMPNTFKDYGAFNTIADLMRDVQGNKVVEKMAFPIEAGVSDNAKFVVLHLYEYDDILTFEEAVNQKLIKKYEGWVGFKNTAKIKSYEDFQDNKEMAIERPLMNYNAGDFIDMYPSRDLFSFVPKYNSWQKRIEKNWNYCITYPSSSFTPSSSADPFTDIIEYTDGINALKAIYFDENTMSDNGTSQLVIYSIAKHGLVVGDYVNIYKTYYDSGTSADTSVVVLYNAEVKAVVDDWIFTVSSASLQLSPNWVLLTNSDKVAGAKLELSFGSKIKEYDIDSSLKFFIDHSDPSKKYYIVNNSYVNFDESTQRISYKKVVSDIECDYYVRIFSRLPNFKFASGDTSSEYEIYRNRDGGENYVTKYGKKDYEFDNHLSRLAFAKNAYSDDVGEIVFTDDISIANLHDNLGRPITSLYLTIIKNNKGYKEWYGYDVSDQDEWNVNMVNKYSSDIEYSHCFGKITCGLETSEESMYDDDVKSIRSLSNVSDGSPRVGYECSIINNNREYPNNKFRITNEEVWYDTDTNFYGDLCYYDNYNATEKHIQYIEHRVNTAQRESKNAKSANYFAKIFYDEIAKDDYDTQDSYEISTSAIDDEANSRGEGYFYIPHYEIPIRTFDTLQSAMPDFLTIRSMSAISDTTYEIHTSQNHYLSMGDKAMLYDSELDVYYDLVALSGDTDAYKVFTCKVYSDKDGKETPIYSGSSETDILKKLSSATANIKLSRYQLFKLDNIDCPNYAKVLKDGTCRVIWREVLNNGFNLRDETVEEYPFTNGAFYINKKIDLYMRRQDPYAIWGLYNEQDIAGDEMDVSNENSYSKEEDIEC